MASEIQGEIQEYREKYWDELDTEGKIERMRSVVKGLQERIATQEGMIENLLQHQHGERGLLGPLARSYNMTPFAGLRSDAQVKVWF